MTIKDKFNPLVFLVFGASGSGKSTLIRELESNVTNVSIHCKGTDRDARQYDGDEIKCHAALFPEEYDYVYSQYGHKYGIQRKQLDDALSGGKHHFIICNDIKTIEDLKRDYGHRVRVIFLRFDAPKDTLIAIQQARNISDDEVNLRVQKIHILNQVFLDRSELFDQVVINKFDAPPSQMLTQLTRIIEAEQYSSKSAERSEIHQGLSDIADTVLQIRKAVRRHAEELGGKPQKDYLFILMTMQQDDPLLDDVLAAIKRAGVGIGLRAERVDDIAFTGEITDKILGSIRCAEYIVADLTHERPNVYYELGYAHAFSKKAILTARKGTPLHFDVQNFPVIFYASSVQLEARLTELLTKLEQEKDDK